VYKHSSKSREIKLLRNVEIDRILWRFLKCIVDIALSHCRNCLRWIQTAKVQEGTLVNLKRLGAQGILRRVFFSNRVINRWNALDQSAVDAPSINAFKQILVKVRNNRMGFYMD